jgi:hypothetical protein
MPMTPEGIPDGPRRRTNASTKLLHEWAQIRYPQVQPIYELRLGPTAKHLVGVAVSPELEAMLRVSNWYADAVFLLPNELLVVESKVDPDPAAIGQVLFYRRLMFETPALAGKTHLPVAAAVLFAEDDEVITPFARDLGVRVEIYTPQWIADYLVQRQFRRRLSPPPGGPIEVPNNRARYVWEE